MNTEYPESGLCTNVTMPTKKQLAAIGIEEQDAESLALLNDSSEPFDSIADWIEENL